MSFPLTQKLLKKKKPFTVLKKQAPSVLCDIQDSSQFCPNQAHQLHGWMFQGDE